MRFKIDKNLLVVCREHSEFPDINPLTASSELCANLIGAGMIEDSPEHWGESVLLATGPRYVSEICKALALFLYGDESRSIPADVFDAFCRLTVVGDGDCPKCGGELIYDETIGHELNDGDYFTPPSYVVDYYVYHCPVCGEIIKSEKEL